MAPPTTATCDCVHVNVQSPAPPPHTHTCSYEVVKKSRKAADELAERLLQYVDGRGNVQCGIIYCLSRCACVCLCLCVWAAGGRGLWIVACSSIPCRVGGGKVQCGIIHVLPQQMRWLGEEGAHSNYFRAVLVCMQTVALAALALRQGLHLWGEAGIDTLDFVPVVLPQSRWLLPRLRLLCRKETEDLARTLSQVRQPNGRLLTCK